MSYVIYEKETTIILQGAHRKEYYDTERAAKAALTRAVKKGGINRDHYGIAEISIFRNTIEKKHIRHGIGPCEGKEYEVPVNTSWTSGPWSETYWAS